MIDLIMIRNINTVGNMASVNAAAVDMHTKDEYVS